MDVSGTIDLGDENAGQTGTHDGPQVLQGLAGCRRLDTGEDERFTRSGRLVQKRAHRPPGALAFALRKRSTWLLQVDDDRVGPRRQAAPYVIGLIAGAEQHGAQRTDGPGLHQTSLAMASEAGPATTVPSKKWRLAPAWRRTGLRNISSRNSSDPMTPRSTNS